MSAPAPRLPRILPYAVFGAGLYLVLHTIGGLLAEVQLANDSIFGGMAAVAGGFLPDVVDRTTGLLSIWSVAAADPATHEFIAWSARAYSGITVLFAATYVLVLVKVWRRLRRHLPPDAGGEPATRNRLRRAAYWRRGPSFAVGAGLADVAAAAVRQVIVERTVAQLGVPNWLIWVAWVLHLLHWALLLASLVMLVVLLHDTRRLRTWLGHAGRALWRLRVVVAAVGVFGLLLLFDPTGQAVDLARRWTDNGTGLGSAALVLVSAVLLGLSAWLYARRVILAEHVQSRRTVPWTPSLLGVAVLTVLLGVLLGWTETFAFTALAVLVLVLGWLVFRTPVTGGTTQQEAAHTALVARQRDASAPEPEQVVAVRRATRALAIVPLLASLYLTLVAYAPVMIVLPLSHVQRSTVFALAIGFVAVALVGAPFAAVAGCAVLRAWDGEVSETPARLETRYLVGAAGVAVTLAVGVVGAVLHWPLVTAFLVLAAFLATVMLLLGEAQRWSETHTAPPGLLGLGFTRLPVATLLIVALVGASFVLNDGSDHNVRRTGTLPSGLSSSDGYRTGVDLTKAFDEWTQANCAGSGHAGETVPLVLVSAPGGGLRAAYWTASTLTGLFGADRSARVPGCDAAPADRLFAMGGASGGSLGVLAYTAGLAGPRATDWYEDQLGQPDFLTDPMMWMTTVDLSRAFIGFGGEDRAARLENSFSAHITGMDQNFLAGTWGLGGRSPLMVLTGTQVESGCRLNVSNLRLTSPDIRADRVGCATLGPGPDQTNAAVTTDLLDVVCDPDGSHPAAITRSTAALLSARFPYVSPSGQMYDCVDPAHPQERTGSTAIVDGGYADDTGIAMLLALWPRLEALITAHNQVSGNATVVPVFLEVANSYAQVASPTQRGRTVQGLVPPLTRSRPDQLDDRAEEQMAAATFAGTVPGRGAGCDLTSGNGRFLVISPTISPGLPAPVAWTLSQLAVDDLDAQRGTALAKPGPTAVKTWADTTVRCA